MLIRGKIFEKGYTPRGCIFVINIAKLNKVMDPCFACSTTDYLYKYCPQCKKDNVGQKDHPGNTFTKLELGGKIMLRQTISAQVPHSFE